MNDINQEGVLKMKKYGVVLSAALIAGLLTGCGGNNAPVEDSVEVVTNDVAEATSGDEKTEDNAAVEEETEEKVTTEATTTEATTTEATTTEATTTEATTTEATTETKTTEKKTTEKKTTEKKTTEKKKTEKKKKTTEKKTTEATTEKQQSNKDIAKGYIGSPLSSLVAAIGGYSSLVQDEGCLEGFDAIAYYDGFSVMCHSEDQVNWIIVDVY